MNRRDFEKARRESALSALLNLRMDRLKQKGVPQTFLNTQFDFVRPDLRQSLVQAVLPLIWSLEKRTHIEDALLKQYEWPPFEEGRSAWVSTREDADSALQQGISGLEEAMDEDLLVLGYNTLLSGLPPAIMPKPDFWRKAMEDSLLNLYYVIEELRLAVISARERSPADVPPNQPVGLVLRLLSYPELDTQMHAQGAINRIRAGWDKLLTNLALDSFQINHGDKFENRIRRMGNHLPERLSSPAQTGLIENLVENADVVATSIVRTFRDADLHFISQQTVEMFGNLDHGLPADELIAIALTERRRLEQSLLLLVGAMALAMNT